MADTKPRQRLLIGLALAAALVAGTGVSALTLLRGGGDTCAIATAEVGEQGRLNVEVGRAEGRIAVLGDSYTAGRGAASVTEGYAATLGKELDVPVLLFGVAGSGFIKEGSCGGARYDRRLAPVAAADPSLILVQGGLNDQGEAPPVLTDAATSVLEELKALAPTAKVVLAGPVDPKGGNEFVARASDALATAADRAGVPYIDMLGWIDDENRGKLIGRDDLHLSQRGHDHVAERLAAELRPLLGATAP